MKTSKVALVAVGALSLVGFGAGLASADPVNAKKSEIIAIECDEGLGSLTIAVNGNGQWSPGLVTTSTQVGVPYRFHFEGSFIPTVGDPEDFVEDVAKPTPHSGRLAKCTFHVEEAQEGGTFVFDGTVWISYTPGR